jgi:hypothetical protein
MVAGAQYTWVALLFVVLATFTSQAEDQSRRNRTPYAGVDWLHSQQIHTTSHSHITNQANLERAYVDGLRFFTLSNYYPSAPWWPMAAVRKNQFWVEHTHPVVVDGTLTPGPFDWNTIIGDSETGWAGGLPEEQRSQFPFVMGKKPFTNIPDDILEAPNAEHHSFTNSRAHACAPGSAFQSGTFDVRNKFETVDHGYAMGVGQTWQEGFDRMFAKLIVPDGGGVTINHPIWSKLPEDIVFEMLDHDPRVLGMEIFNYTCILQREWEDCRRNEALWDTVLASGRQCFGFFVPDHRISAKAEFWLGRNVLLVDAFTVEDCLRAYRQGQFYGALKGSGLKFTRIQADEESVNVKTNGATRIEFITENGIAETVLAPVGSYTLPAKPDGSPDVAFVRVKAYDDDGEILFSQPTLYGDPTL